MLKNVTISVHVSVYMYMRYFTPWLYLKSGMERWLILVEIQ